MSGLFQVVADVLALHSLAVLLPYNCLYCLYKHMTNHSCCFCFQVVGDVLALHSLAVQLRRRRYDGGALRLDNVKLW